MAECSVETEGQSHSGQVNYVSVTWSTVRNVLMCTGCLARFLDAIAEKHSEPISLEITHYEPARKCTCNTNPHSLSCAYGGRMRMGSGHG